MTPLRRLDPDPLEGPSSFVIRLATANRIAAHEVLEMDLLSPWPSMQVLQERVAPLRRGSAAYCPSCLGLCGFGRLGWELTFADACTSCGRWLVDTCPGCDGRVSWKRAAIGRCDCGCSLVDQSAPMAPAALGELSRAFELTFAAPRSIHREGKDALEPTQLRDLVRLLGSYGGPDQRPRPQKRAYSSSLAASWPASTIAAEVLATWPRGFEEYLDRLAARSTATEVSGSLLRTFGGFYRALYKGVSHSAFDFVRDRFQAYVVQYWPGALNGRNKRLAPEISAESKWEPLSHAKVRLSASGARMRTLVATGKLRAVQSTKPSGRAFVMLHRDDVDASVSTLASEFTLTEAAVELGLKRSRLASLLPRICPGAYQAIEGRSPWAIPSEWLDSWRKRLADLPVVEASDATETLGRLLRFGAWSTARLAKFICDIASGSMPVVGRLTGMRGWPAMAFGVIEFQSWCAANVVQCSAMTVPEAAERMGIKQEVAYLLVRRGLLESTIRRDGARKWSSISDVQLERLNAEYVWCRDVAARLGRSPKAISILLLERGVAQASGPLADRSRQILYRRRDVLVALSGMGKVERIGGSE